MSQPVPNDSAAGPRGSRSNEATQAIHRRPRSGALNRSGGRGGAPQLPAVGEELFGFRLVAVLGQGAMARVFRAEQADLAGRPVVLKISAIQGDEPQTLAQLQHTHIVPIYSLHDDPACGLRAVCMPYFGGASLAAVLDKLWSEPARPDHGEQLARALAAVGAPLVAPPGSPAAAGAVEEAPLARWRRLDYVRAAAWVVARLAEGLQHAHERGILHRDIKPSNVLLGADGQPLLLDFNVSQKEDSEQAQATLGGTVAYMSPEHLRALAACDPVLAREVRRGSDLYSLGMVLYEMLAGCNPFDHKGTYSPVIPVVVAMALERSQARPSVRTRRPDVPWSLESIVRKCLAPDPAERYQQAEHLAEDLRRFLEDRPLRYAPELSRVERARKWLRRHPRLTSSGSVAVAAALLLVAAGAALAGVRHHLVAAQEQLRVAQAEDRRRAFEAGTVRALCLVNTTTDVQDHLGQGLRVCESTLALYGVLDDDAWQDNPAWQGLEPGVRQQLGEDTRELLLLLAWARTRTRPGEEAALRDALAVLNRAEAVQGLAPSRALWEDRAQYRAQLGDTAGSGAAHAEAARLQPAGARDHYLLATAYSRTGRYEQAIPELDEALRLNPRHYWSAVQRGICYQELGRHALAVADFGTCVGLWPEFAWGYFNRGCALDRSGHKPQAVADYTAALERDPDFVLAYLNRGLAYLELRQYEPALADFRKAAELGREDAVVHMGRGVALEGLKRPAEADAAFELAFARAGADRATRTRLGWVYGFAVSARLPAEARAAFDEVLRLAPEQPQALYGRAMLLAGQGRDQETEAITLFGRASDAAPGFVEPRRYRAVLLARRGNFEAASQDVNWCLEREPESGATLYAAACVAARAADRAPERGAARQAAEQALAFLGKAFARGYGRDRAANDPDLAGVRELPAFKALVDG